MIVGVSDGEGDGAGDSVGYAVGESVTVAGSDVGSSLGLGLGAGDSVGKADGPSGKIGRFCCNPPLFTLLFKSPPKASATFPPLGKRKPPSAKMRTIPKKEYFG